MRCADRQRGQSERSAFRPQFHAVAGGLFRDNVDGAEQGGRAVGARRRALEDLNALDLGHTHREVHGVVAGLRVGDAYPVQQDGNLLAGSATQADVGLHPLGTPLTDVHAHGELEQIVDIGGRNRGDGHAVQHGYDAHALAQISGQAAGGDDDTLELFEGGIRELLRPGGRADGRKEEQDRKGPEYNY